MNSKHSKLKWSDAGIDFGMLAMVSIVSIRIGANGKLQNHNQKDFFDNLEFSLQMGLIPG